MKLLDETKAILDQKHKPDGYNIGINGGAAAGQTVMHLHIHLIPRYEGDRADPRGGVRWVLPENAAYWSKK
jgi:diadenosine tetraphosphate (Ap4A) HIT family hydrolase